MRTLLKSQKPKMENKTAEEYEKEVSKFQEALKIMKSLMEEQTNFNGQLIEEVNIL
jgi:hypothetical protein